MTLKYLKKLFVFSAIFAGIFLYVLSCENPNNPFATNLGAKVNIEPPTVNIDFPIVGAYLKGTVTFEGRATAYRDLKSVEVKILNENETRVLLDWTEIALEGEPREKTWKFTLDTLNSKFTERDGTVRNLNSAIDETLNLNIILRASDIGMTAEGVTSLFVSKNNPPTVSMSRPRNSQYFGESGERRDLAGLDWVGAPGEDNPNPMPYVYVGTELTGTVVDRRGIKPLHPLIKFWPANIPTSEAGRIDPVTNEPYDDDVEWGWVQLPLSGIDDYDSTDSSGISRYEDRTNMRVVNTGNFALKLARYTVVDERLKFEKISGDNYVFLPTGEYRFRIKASETFFDDRIVIGEGENETKNPRYMYPRGPRGGEKEEVRYFPPLEDEAFWVEIKTQGARPEIELDNSDISEPDLKKQPNIYITETTANKIAKSAWTGRDVFRLRILATCGDGIHHATLKWSHTSGSNFRNGNLAWDNNGAGYISGTPTDGYLGDDNTDPRGGKFFTYIGEVDANFTPSRDPYQLIVRVSADATEDNYTDQKFMLYLDDRDPEATIRTVRGASEYTPETTSPPSDSVYTVNGNIQVSVDTKAFGGGILAEKWWIEATNPSAAGSMKSLLDTFKADPTNGDASFFDNIVATLPLNMARSGLVLAPSSSGVFAEDRASNFKVNVKQFQDDNGNSPVDVWLYVIVQDGAYNLGYKIQKLHVDESKDTPVLTVSGLSDTITNSGDLYIAMGSGNSRENVLSGSGSGTSIELNFKDDDAIRPLAQGAQAGGLTIKLTAHNYNGAAGKTDVEVNSTLLGQIFNSNPSQDLSVLLPQSIMSQALGLGSGALPEGLYTIKIEINDDLYSKVYFNTQSDNAPPKSSGEKIIHFAVSSSVGPAVTIEKPDTGSMQTSAPVPIYGKVTSRLRVQSMDISFTPDITSSPPNNSETSVTTPTQPLTLYLTEQNAIDGVNAVTSPLTGTDGLNATTGEYTYYWRKINVNFDPYTPPAPGFNWRRFNVRAWDGLTDQGNLEREVQVDTTPPNVAPVLFNLGRVYQGDYPLTVNGKVPIEVSVTDTNGIKQNGNTMAINWFILPKGTSITTFDWATTTGYNGTNGRAGTFDARSTTGNPAGNNVVGGNYRFFINTGHRDTTGTLVTTSSTYLPDGEYELYVVAWDNADNRNTPTEPLYTFKVDQTSDYPYLRRDNMYPGNDVTVGVGKDLKISGRIFDDDGYDAAKATVASTAYVQIRFRNADNTIWGVGQNATFRTWTGINNTQYVANATTGWITINTTRVTSGAARGDLEYEFVFDVPSLDNPATPAVNEGRHPYFRGDGERYYQIRVIDEVNASAAAGIRDPWGKNPDLITGADRLAPAPAGTNPTITVATVYYPGADPVTTPNADPLTAESASFWYRFQMKVTPPRITFPPIAESDRIYKDVTGLLTALNGGTIQDISLRDAYFTYGGGRHELVKNPVAVENTQPGIVPNSDTVAAQNLWTWTLDSAWLAPFNTTALPDGTHSLTVQATDTLLNNAAEDWKFTKDTTGPTITFEIIRTDRIMTISGAEPVSGTSQIFVSGGFSDLYSNLGFAGQSAESFEYKLWTAKPGTTSPTNWTPQLISTGGAITVLDPPDPTNRRGATWKVAIPGTHADDGPYKFQIKVTDKLGNETISDVIDFIVDRRNPETLVTADNLRFINNAGASSLKDKASADVPNGPLAVSDRVFSVPTAAGKVFTLSGIIYEHNLNTLTANFRNGETAVGTPQTISGITINPYPSAPPPVYSTITWHDGAKPGVWLSNAANTFRVKQAEAADVTAFGLTGAPNYRYVWELDVTKDDFDALFTGNGDEGANRSISVSANDLARKNSGAQNWLFKLDNTGPTISFTNLDPGKTTPPAGTALEEQSITLQGQAEDATNIQLIEYKIDKYNPPAYTTPGAIWNPALTGGTGAWADGTWTTYADLSPATTVTWRINTGITDDGYYRVTIRARDGSLNTTAAGNIATTSPIYFFVDRKGPVLNWGTNNSDFRRWDNANNITFTVTASDVNTIAAPPVAPAKQGTLTNSSTKADTGATVTYTVTDGDTDSATLNVTVTSPSPNNIPAGQKYTLTLFVYDKAGIQDLSTHTITFTLDTNPPGISLAAIVNDNVILDTEAITGRVIFRGTFTKIAGTSPIKRVAYKITTATPTMPTNLDEAALVADGWYFNYNFTGTPPSPLTTANPYKMWNNAGVSPNPPASPTGAGLAEIDQGDKVANLKVYDTRRLVTLGSPVLGSGTTYTGTTSDGKTLVFGNANLPNGEIIHELKIWLLAIDEAGNSTLEGFTRWVYPKGDVPIVTEISSPNKNDSEVNRKLNGSITIAGKAADNYRIGRVWFRVLNAADSSVMPLSVPKWDEFWNALAGTEQTPESKTEYNGTATSGWYMANGGGSKEVAWWAQINTKGELEPSGDERKITIQVIAEDMIFDDETGENTVVYSSGNWVSRGNNLYSEQEAVNATVVTGAPIFANEVVKSSASGSSDPWGSLLTTNVRARASYQVTVKHPTGVRIVRWTNAPYSGAVTSTTNLMDPEGLYAAAYNGASGYLNRVGTETTGTGGNNAVAVKAEPKTPLNEITSGQTYMVWEWGSDLSGVANAPVSLPLPTGTGVSASTANQRFAIFTANTSKSLTNAVVLQADSEGNYEWVITVDLNTMPNPIGMGINSGTYKVELEATDTSYPVPITSRKTASIPVDNNPPTGRYLHTTNIAGTAPTFGGDAIDPDPQPNGLARVVMWFSRRVDTVETSIVWDRDSNYVDGFNGATMATPPLGVKAATGVTWPAPNATSSVKIPDMAFNDPANANFTTTANNYYIVIDRQDPLGNQTHHGHKQAMGWARDGETGGTNWYVSLDSTKMESGRVTAHYIVYDKAGNGTYYNQQLMILNSVPKISRITLATDLGKSGVNLQSAISGGTANVTFAQGDIAGSNGGALGRIRSAMGTTASAAAGISEEIPVDTSKPGVYSLIVDQKDFMVRNNLLAVRVETTQGLSTASGKNRSFRVEYVSSTRALSGFTGTTSLIAAGTGIRAGKVYIINNVGTNFPWGVFGAPALNPGESYVRGTAFLAMVDGDKVNLGTTTGFGAPSVWELNGDRTNVPVDLQLADVTYTVGTLNVGQSADFVYKNAAFATATTDASHIVDFDAGGTNGANLYTVDDFVLNNRNIPGTPKPYPANNTGAPNVLHSLFIVKIFDGPETDLFGDFALLSVRVNNNDKTPPYAQLYDLNPKTEETTTLSDALKPVNIGDNRTMGGLYQTGTPSTADPARSGHIEPRTTTSLTSSDMGGAATAARGTVTRPFADSAAFFYTDTVSGDVIVRGYAEDNQRIARVDLEFYDSTNTRIGASTTILTQGNNNSDKTNSAPLMVPTASNGRVQFTETLDLNRHRVEWAYRWTSDDLPGGDNVVGNISVRVRSYNANSALRTTNNNTAVTALNERLHTSPLRVYSALTATPTPSDRLAYDSFNPGFPASGSYASGNANTRIFVRYNEIRVNLRPYIVGFLRNQNESYHNIRSRQGRFIVRREEVPAITGFNLGSGTLTTNIYLPYATGTGTAVTLGAFSGSNDLRNNYVVNTAHRNEANNNRIFTTRYRVFNAAVAATAATGDGKIELTVNGYSAVNTPRTGTTDAPGSIRRLVSNKPVVQPWNKEYNPSVDGSQMWDDYTMIYVWRSDDAVTGNVDHARFKRLAGFNIDNPSMSINPHDGTLWASHQAGGNIPTYPSGTQVVAHPGGGTYISSNGNSNTYAYGSTYTNTSLTGLRQVASWSEHMADTNIFVSSHTDGTQNGTIWAMSNIITIAHSGRRWGQSGGLWLWGPIGSTGSNNGNPRIFNGPRTITESFTATGDSAPDNPSGFPFPSPDYGSSAPSQTGHYGIESHWYNGSVASRTVTEPQNQQQFRNPHTVTYAASDTATTEHIHVAYFDTKDGSLKYRYNVRDNTGTVNDQTMTKNWVNLDGGADLDDSVNADAQPGSASIGLNANNLDANYGYNGGQVRNRAQNGFDPTATGRTDLGQYTQGNISMPYYTATGAYYFPQGNTTVNAVLVPNGSYVTSGTPIYSTSGGNITAGDTGFVVLTMITDRQRASATDAGNETTRPIPLPRTINAATATSVVSHRIYALNTAQATARILIHTDRPLTKLPAASSNVAGRHNSIAVNEDGYPVIAYYDESARNLRIAVSTNTAPSTAQYWKVIPSGDIFKGTDSVYSIGTGEYVSIQINGKTLHIAAMNGLRKSVVYIKGTLAPNAAAGSILTDITVQEIDNVGNVGSWCKLSLDANGNPWIAYMDEGYRGSKDGAKVAYYMGDTARNNSYKYSGTNYQAGDIDMYNKSIAGWEFMHVPTNFRVENAQLGMERFPTIRRNTQGRVSGSGGLSSFAAVGFLGQGYYRIAYYIE